MNTTTLKIFGLSALAAISLIGCGNNNDTASDLTVAKPVVTQITAVCDDHSLKNRLNDAVQSALLDSSLNRLSGLSEVQLQDMEDKIRSRLTAVTIDLQNVSNVENGCVADIYITPQATDLAAAELMFSQAGVDLAKKAEESSVQIVAGRLIATGVPYQIQDGKAVLSADHPLFNLASEVIATAASAVNVATPSEDMMAAANVVAPAIAMRPQAVEQSQQQEVLAAAPRANVNRENQPRQQARDTARPANRENQPRQAVREAPKKAEAPKPKPKVERNEPKAVKADESKSETAKTTTLETKQTREIVKSEPKAELKADAKPKAEAKPEPKAEPKPEPKPEMAPTAQPNKSAQITVVETSDTY